MSRSEASGAGTSRAEKSGAEKSRAAQARAAKSRASATAKGARPASTSATNDDELVRLADIVRARAHSPYSKIQVGAALRARDGRVFTGCNVENASYGLTLCAERSAVVQAVSAGATEFDAIAITTSLDRAMMPCGACRQVLSEFAPRLRVVVVGLDGRRVTATLDRLLPSAFGPGDLT